MMNTLLANPEHQTTAIRVVFDGAQDAGKTTAVYSLAKTLGSTALSPDGNPGSTEWFDWLTYSGGQHDGNALQVEIVTVPGAPELAGRRQHLVTWGDVVVFVADTRPTAFDVSIEAFRQLKSDLLPRADIPVVVLANKRDLDDTVSVEQVRSALALGDNDAVIETIGTSGVGVREGFIYAVRAALSTPITRTESTTSDELLDELQALGGLTAHTTGVDIAALAAPLAMVVLSNAQLNPDGLVDGAVVLQPAHWQMIVEVVNGRSQLPLADGTDDAATAFELLSWGLIRGTESVVFADPGDTNNDATDEVDDSPDEDTSPDDDQVHDNDVDPNTAEANTEDPPETTPTEGTTPMPHDDSSPALAHQASPAS